MANSLTSGSWWTDLINQGTDFFNGINGTAQAQANQINLMNTLAGRNTIPTAGLPLANGTTFNGVLPNGQTQSLLQNWSNQQAQFNGLNQYKGPTSSLDNVTPSTTAPSAVPSTLANAGALLNGLWTVYSGIAGMRQNNKRFKSDMESAQLQRSIAREQMDIMRKEYNRLNAQRAATSRAYGG